MRAMAFAACALLIATRARRSIWLAAGARAAFLAQLLLQFAQLSFMLAILSSQSSSLRFELLALCALAVCLVAASLCIERASLRRELHF